MAASRLVRRCIASIVAFGCASVVAFTVVTVRAGTESRWSDPATWSGRVPRAGDAVTIPRGRAVVLDVSPPPLGSLDVNGTLRFDDRDLTLRARGVRVRGNLVVGGASGFAHRAEIVLAGTADGRGAIAVSDGGRIDLHGVPRVSWTTLAATATPHATRLVLSRAVDWVAGDRVVVAPSGFAASETEEAVVASVDRDRLTLRAPLAFRHWGTITHGVDERAEVGLLSHTVVVRSEDASVARGTGGQVIVLRGGTLAASNVEFRGLGQLGEKGRYPIHFHEVGDGSASSIVASSIDHSFNRCLTIHGTNDVTVRGNVAYDTFGHCYFLEDGVERGNLFEDDIGMLTRVPAPDRRILATDERPATFWIANPDNTLRGNRAAGSDGYGFWYNLDVVPTGLARGTPNVHPRNVALATFADNAAHANEHDGLFVDNLRNPPGVSEAPNYDPPETAHFAHFTSYKNRRHAVWLRGRNLVLDDARLADNAIGATFAAADAVLRGGIVVGESDNATGPPKPFDPSFPIRGFEFYDGPVTAEGVHFANFVPNALREASALSALEYSPFFIDPTQAASGLSFEDAQPVYFRPYVGAPAADGYRSVAFRDLDGSVTGRAGATVVYDSPLLADGCRRVPAWHAALCDAHIASLFVLDLDAVHAARGPLRVASENAAASNVPAIVLAGNPAASGPNVSFQTNIAVGGAYTIAFARGMPAHTRFGLHGSDEGDSLAVDIGSGRCTLRGVRGKSSPDRARITLVAHGPAGHASAVVDVSSSRRPDTSRRPRLPFFRCNASRRAFPAVSGAGANRSHFRSTPTI